MHSCKERPVVPKLVTDLDNYRPAQVPKRSSDMGKMQDSASRVDRVPDWLSPVHPREGAMHSVMTAVPLATKTPLAPMGPPAPLLMGAPPMAWPAEPYYPAQPQPGFPDAGYPAAYPQAQHCLAPGSIAPPPSPQVPASDISRLNEEVNREKMLVEQYRYAGVQADYEPPSCPIVGGYGKNKVTMKRTTGGTFPITPPGAPFKFDPKAPEFHPGQKEMEIKKKPYHGPLIV
ncbi:hypothetical protein PHISP_05567 [Aspergillus sp. HF37]|nr:hypothetical protein PHISP_05567 [Aspergillus sp. HF37]